MSRGSGMSAGGFRGRATVLVVLAGILALALSGCVSKEDSTGAVADASVDPAQLAGLTLRVGDQKGGTESLMRAAGELDSLPFKVEFSTFTSGPPEIEAATAGKIDFAVTGNTPPIFGAASNAKIKIVSAYTNNAGGDVILVPAGSTLTSVEQLKGKKVAVAKGSSAHGNLLEQLSKANLKLGTDVTPVFLQPADALSAFSSGAVDAWAIWDPYTAIVQKDSGAKILASGTGVVNGYGFGIASNEPLPTPSATPRCGSSSNTWPRPASGRQQRRDLVAAVREGDRHRPAGRTGGTAAQRPAGHRDRRHRGRLGAETGRRLRRRRPARPQARHRRLRRQALQLHRGALRSEYAMTAEAQREAHFHWFLPTSGDGREVIGGLQSAGILGTASAIRPPDLDYLALVAKTAERLGFESVLTPTGTWCHDAWLTTAALIREASRLKFLVAFRPG